jgi:hypothetical protein
MTAEYGIKLENAEVSTRPEELSTTTIRFNEGTSLDEISVVLFKSGAMCRRSGKLLRGSRRGRLASLLIIKWLAPRRVRAETTWFTLNDGLSGT